MNLEERLKEYITDENDSEIFYEELAKIAPNDNYRQLLMAMSNDEEDHAETFKQIYHHMTGKTFDPEVSKPIFESSFDDILWMRVLDETSNYRKYGYQYFQTDPRSELSAAYYIAKTDENVHAMRLLYMILK